MQPRAANESTNDVDSNLYNILSRAVLKLVQIVYVLVIRVNLLTLPRGREFE